MIWVLERGYKYSKEQVVRVLKEILSTIEFNFENQQCLWMSIVEYENSTADFSDILIGKLNILNKCSYTFTFDVKASSLATFNIVE